MGGSVTTFEPLPAGRAELVDRVIRVRFTPTRGVRGYDARSVDALLRQVVDSLSDPPQALPMTGAKLHRSPLRQVRFIAGYAISEVDEFLFMLGQALDRLL